MGVMGVRFYRPFPDAAIANALKGKKGVIVFEKALSYGYEGALASDLKSALYEHLAGTGNLPVVQNFILGIGGRDIQDRRFDTNPPGCDQRQNFAGARMDRA